MRIKFIFFILMGASLLSCVSGKRIALDNINNGEQFVYTYISEGIGYSDIPMLYNTDSLKKRVPFFERPTVQSTGVNIQCSIRKTIIRQTDSIAHTCFELLDPLVKIENEGIPVDVEIIKKEMSKLVFADIGNSGNILLLKIDTSVSYLTAGIIKNILGNTQAVIPSKIGQSWQVMEENTIGFYKAKYQLVNKSADSIEYVKTNEGYEKIKSARKSQRFVPESKTIIVTDASGLVQRINISESLITLFSNDTIVASGSRVKYSLLSSTKINSKELSALEVTEHSCNYLKAIALSDQIPDEEINRLAYKNTLANDNLETLIQKLSLAKYEDEKQESDLIVKFRALAWLSENDCSKMASMLKKAMPESDTFRILSKALAIVKTEFAINEIAGVVAERRNEERVMIELLPVLATSTSATAQAVDIVKELAFSNETNQFITSTAQLTLGGMVKNLKEKDEQKADELVDLIIDKMKRSTDTLQQLFIYGNTGSYKLFPVLLSYINSTYVSDEIRKAAVFATRFIENMEVSSLLNQLAVNKDTVLAKAATETISFRNNYFQKN